MYIFNITTCNIKKKYHKNIRHKDNRFNFLTSEQNDEMSTERNMIRHCIS